jgi:cobalt/nickel transport system ATP-binding protein
MATHDLEWVYRWADWVFVLERGKLVLEGTPQDVFTQRDVMETLRLGVPLAFELLSLLDEVDRVTTIEQLKTKILQILERENKGDLEQSRR